MQPQDRRTAAPRAVRAALASGGDLGMFFGLADPGNEPIGWQQASSLYALHRGGPLDAILESVRTKLGGCEPKIAASLFFQGYASRLLSPQLGCIAMAGCVPEMDPERLFWRRPAEETIALGMTAGPGWTASSEILIEQVVRASFEEHLQPLTAALQARVRIAEGLLRGNAAAALIGGLRLLSEYLEPSWTDLAARALAQPCLRGCGSLQEQEPVYVRHSCCLYYRVSSGEKCGDCPLTIRVPPRENDPSRRLKKNRGLERPPQRYSN
jgi:iron complex transport system ATP-binding protein